MNAGRQDYETVATLADFRDKPPRLRREARTVAVMVGIYCRDIHSSPRGQLCNECQDLVDYALLRLSKCPWQEAKTTCANCPVHCYKPERREQIRRVMRYAGPRMLLRHPILALRHLGDGLRKSS